MQTNTVAAAMIHVGLVWALTGWGAASLSASLIAHYTFDSDAVSDSSGNANHATAVNSAGITATDKVLGAGALDLSANDSVLYSAPRSLALPDMSGSFSSAATLSMWVKLDADPPPNNNLTGLVGLDGAVPGDPGTITHYPYTNGWASFGTFRASANRVDVLSTSLPTLTEWHHVTITSDATDGWRLYANGVLVTSTTQGTFTIGNWTLGKSTSTSTFVLDGKLDDVALFSTGLSAAKVAALYSLATTPGYGYDAGEANSLFAIFDSAGGSTVIDGTYWTYKKGLTTTIGQLEIVDGKPFLRLDAAGNGLSIPEPASFALFALAGLAAWRRR